jgi:hypothetical protein
MTIPCNILFMRITTSLENGCDLPCEVVSSTCMNGMDAVHCSPDMVQVPGILAPISGKTIAGVTSLMNTLLFFGMVHSPGGTDLKVNMDK